MACSAQPVEYSQGDSGDTSTDTATVTSTRLLGEGVDAIIGAASSSVTLTVIDAITTAGVTMFSPANTSPALSTYDDKGLYFRDAPPDGLQGAIVSGLVQEDGNASVFILNLDDAYGNGIADVVETVLTDAGVEVLGHIAYDPTAASFDAEVGEVVAADPDAVVLISFDEGSRSCAPPSSRASDRPSRCGTARTATWATPSARTSTPVSDVTH